MNFLDKLYESNYFGIGLFAVISFLVVTFLIVLFFGKRDEKKRLEETKELPKAEAEDTFKETSETVPVEVSVAPINEEQTSVILDNAMPVMPNVEEVPKVEPVMSVDVEQPVAPIINEVPVSPINFTEEPLTPVAPINYDYEPKQFVGVPKEEVASIDIPVTPVINETPSPIFTEPVRDVEPVRVEPTTYSVPTEPKVIEPIRITIPEETINSTPVIEEVKPVGTETYYNPIEKPQSPEEIEVPSVDFDALAKSISDELDELENSTNTYHEEVKVTPIDEVVSKPATQFSSVYVNEPVKTAVSEEMELPKKIDLPTMKSDDIEPENYNI